MKKDLNIFVDPKTQTPLCLKINKAEGEEILQGKLYNKNKSYPIINGIPRFVPPSFYKNYQLKSNEEQTAKSFGDKWREKRNQHLGDVFQDQVSLKEQFMAMLGCNTATEFKNLLKNAKLTLNAGCGVAWSEYLFNYNKNTMRHCIDLSLAVETAYQRTKANKNMIVSQASIFELPYADQTFDIVYSNGVIHHTPDAEKAFMSLAKKVKTNGLIGIYIYNVKPLLRELADTEIRKTTTKMSYEECMTFSKQMTTLGKAFKQFKTPLNITEDIDILGMKKGKYDLQTFIYDHIIKCWYNPKWDETYADLVNQDWYNPYYASHHTKEEVLSWFKEAKIKNIKLLQPKGWEHSGHFISGRKK
ncbi:MAG: hypothetical protein A2306_05440 [Omnitrophica WOR_2 bacterium RIFOXYB2_FULL_38_16]|nr:MAG: hypothetical protein A2Y06_02935 [Omnitrophica WOR_2 bacterium GWA2_37_7]OGX56847.1 MAG: hypothetical protein A2306_05440 [Omnitrophica WOR_2 bacterium RIFOXYB2_FULL_38_16]OGX57602.1 MAG: hypothetical protein A2447_00575 [Omnitrophica WOR_2 bacterium RIFOXYC2_FULL_38_12]